jgi:hypothetical protein
MRTKTKKKRDPEFREEDLKQGHVVTDSDFGRVIHVNSSHCIAPDGTNIYEF